MSIIRRPRPLVVGLVVLGVYVAAVLATAQFGGHDVRPLFDGIGPPPAYQWVKPPPQFKKGNIVPTPGSGEIGFKDGTSEAGAFQTPDGQFVVDLLPGTVPPHGADTKLVGQLTPLDPGTLGPVPTPLRADGNAYRIELSYLPSKAPLDALSTPGDLFLTTPEPAEVILYSTDGRTWDRLETKQVAAGATVGAGFTRAGWYLATTSAPAAATTTPTGSGGPNVVVVGVVVVMAAALVLVLGPWAWRRRRRPTPRRRHK